MSKLRACAWSLLNLDNNRESFQFWNGVDDLLWIFFTIISVLNSPRNSKFQLEMFRHLAHEECEFFHTLDPILDLANGAHIVNNPNAVPLCKTLKKLTSLFKQSHIF